MSAHPRALLLALLGATFLSAAPVYPALWAQGATEPAIAPASRTINLTQEQRFIIKEIVLKDLDVPKVSGNPPETVGDAVPQNIELHPMPRELVQKVPQAQSHAFFVKEADNAIVLVSPADRRVADVIH